MCPPVSTATARDAGAGNRPTVRASKCRMVAREGDTAGDAVNDGVETLVATCPLLEQAAMANAEARAAKRG